MAHPFDSAVPASPVVIFGSEPAWLAWAVATASARAITVVCADDDQAQALERDLGFFQRTLALAPPPRTIIRVPDLGVSPYVEQAPEPAAIIDRASALGHLAYLGDARHVVIVSAPALLHRSMPAAALRAATRRLAVGATIDRDELAAALVAAGYARVPLVDDPGTFAVRGGVVDVFPPTSDAPVRCELFGDSIESLRSFDPLTQRTTEPVTDVLLTPARETIVTGTFDLRARIRDLADAQTFPSKATRRLIEQLEGGDRFVGLEAYTPLLHAAMAPLWDYLPADTVWCIANPDAIDRAAAVVGSDAEARHAQRLADQLFAIAPDAHLASLAEWQAAIAARPQVVLPALEVLAHQGAATLRLDLRHHDELRRDLERARDLDSPLQPLIDAIARWRRQGLAIVIGADGTLRAQRLGGALTARGIEVPIDTDAPSAGFVSERDRLVVLTAVDLFGTKHGAARAPRRRAGKDVFKGGLGDFSQLKPGDYLVHQRHGVARYGGLQRLPIATSPTGGSTELDCLELQYDGGTLYLPVYRLGEVQRFVGNEGAQPRLDRLGGVTWLATQTKVARHVRALAEELLQLYAQRAALPGHAFPPADESFHEFEDRFPYTETADQQAAIDAVLADMESARPMDRLVCGDVGYGKTEVALRAIFRAVQGGRQAVLLAPTTVLVEQHVRTMQERFAGSAVNVGKLSRFQSKAEQQEVLRRAAAGQLDVVVGTHRLLSADVRFRELGLVVIDEEQRFGVAHKERLKKFRTQLDVLTLTATPIPRTLHLAMSGLRDLSIIATAPTNRRAVRSFVSRVDDAAIREAIERELGRGGQIFFVTHHIHRQGQSVDVTAPAEDDLQAHKQTRKKGPKADTRSIQEWADYLHGLVPRLRVAVAHGEQTPEALEDVMLRFVQGDLDCLVATTIVESGLDIPRANTMFVASAHTFGLAQLYQLRGRIGRSAERAYCYFLVDSPEHVSDDARKRLEALQRYTELGAGFQIASRDLEIRGGGELLGARQSGSIAAVGFDTYIRMLEETVAELRGQPIHSAVDPELTVESPGFIPDDYVPDPRQRLDWYKRLSSAHDDAELAQLVEELADRYGAVPPDVSILVELMALKAIARRLGVVSLELARTRMAIAAAGDPPWTRQAGHLGWKRAGDGRWLYAMAGKGPALQPKEVLQALLAHAT